MTVAQALFFCIIISKYLQYLSKFKVELNRIGTSFPLHLIKRHREVGKCCLPAYNCVVRLQMKDIHLKEYTAWSLYNQAYSCH